LKKGSKTAALTAAAFHEVHANEPKVVAQTRRKSGPAQAKKQLTAIALSKARAAGARIPKAAGGGLVTLPKY